MEVGGWVWVVDGGGGSAGWRPRSSARLKNGAGDPDFCPAPSLEKLVPVKLWATHPWE